MTLAAGKAFASSSDKYEVEVGSTLTLEISELCKTNMQSGYSYSWKITTSSDKSYLSFTSKSKTSATVKGLKSGRLVGIQYTGYYFRNGVKKTTYDTFYVRVIGSGTPSNGPATLEAYPTPITMKIGETKWVYAKQTRAIGGTSFFSGDKSIATVTLGDRMSSDNFVTAAKITAIKAGKVTIYAKNVNGLRADVEVTVLDNSPTSCSIVPNSLSLETGNSYTLSAKLTPNGATSSLEWTTSNSDVAVVNQSGKVTAKGVGSTYIWAETYNGQKGYCKVTVISKSVTSVSIKDALNMKVGDVYTLTPTITPSDAVTTFSWSTDNAMVASVLSTGQVTANSAGTANITVKTSNGKYSTCKVTVKDKETHETIKVKSNSYARRYGEDNPAFGYTASSKLDGEPEIVCDANAASPVGTYPIRIEKGTVTNENVSFEYGVLTIEPAALLVIADDKQMVKGESIPAFTSSYRGFKNNENANVLENAPEFSCAATPASATGRYPIKVYGAKARNYEISFVEGTLTITEPPSHGASISNTIAGNLKNAIASKGFTTDKVQSMKISGYLNGTDILLIRNMLNDGVLHDLDLTGCFIVEGGSSYSDPTDIVQYYTSNDEIGPFMFAYCDNLQTIKLPESVKKIESCSFASCRSLSSVVFPHNLSEINYMAFSDCGKLVDISIPGGVTDIEENAFSDCASLREIMVDSENRDYTSIDGILFTKDMKKLQICPMAYKASLYEIPDGVEEIGDYAFYGCASIESIRMPESLRIIGSQAFMNAAITAAIIPYGVSSIGNMAFYGCRKLKSANLQHSIEKIESSTFDGCENLSYVRIPTGIREIDYDTFAGCESLATIECWVSDVENLEVDYSSYTKDYTPFRDIPDGCTWIVPEGKEEAYKSQPWWRSSWKIRAELPVDVKSATIDRPSVSYSDGTLSINASKAGAIRIYTTDGVLVENVNAKAGDSYQISLPKGIYVINGKKFQFWK